MWIPKFAVYFNPNCFYQRSSVPFCLPHLDVWSFRKYSNPFAQEDIHKTMENEQKEPKCLRGKRTF